MQILRDKDVTVNINTNYYDMSDHCLISQTTKVNYARERAADSVQDVIKLPLSQFAVQP